MGRAGISVPAGHEALKMPQLQLSLPLSDTAILFLLLLELLSANSCASDQDERACPEPFAQFMASPARGFSVQQQH